MCAGLKHLYAMLVRLVLPLRLQCVTVQLRLYAPRQLLGAGVCGTAPVQAVQQLHLIHPQRCMHLSSLMTVVSTAGGGMQKLQPGSPASFMYTSSTYLFACFFCQLSLQDVVRFFAAAVVWHVMKGGTVFHYWTMLHVSCV